MLPLRRVISTVCRFTASLSHLPPRSTVLHSRAIVSHQIVTRLIATSTTVWKKKEVDDGLPTDYEKKIVKSLPDGPTVSEDMAGSKISLLSWNIDGLDGNSLERRMLEVYFTVLSIKPDFVFLQEVSELCIDKLLMLEDFYNIYFSNRNSKHFTAILVRKGFSLYNHEVNPFKNSGRTLQVVEGKFREFHVFLLNTHLESLNAQSNKRSLQLKQCFYKIVSISKKYPNALIFFAGDLNLRDKELCKLPAGVVDAYLAAGARKKWRYTWDTLTNKNKKCSHGARCRFDRFYLKAPRPLIKITFRLKGKKLIPAADCHASDHYAIHSTLTLQCSREVSLNGTSKSPNLS